MNIFWQFQSQCIFLFNTNSLHIISKRILMNSKYENRRRLISSGHFTLNRLLPSHTHPLSIHICQCLQRETKIGFLPCHYMEWKDGPTPNLPISLYILYHRFVALTCSNKKAIQGQFMMALWGCSLNVFVFAFVWYDLQL